MIIPEKVNILYKTYTIDFIDNLHDGDIDLYGQIQYIDEKILLNTGSSEEQQRATLVHELLHGMDEMYSIELKENQVEKLGNTFYMLIRDNPDMFAKKDGKSEITVTKDQHITIVESDGNYKAVASVDLVAL